MLSILSKFLLGTTMKKKIMVVVISHLDDFAFFEREIEQYELPEDFSTIDTITIHNQEWVLVSAEPVHAIQYSFTKKLTLRVNSKESLQSRKFVNDPASGSIMFGKKPEA